MDTGCALINNFVDIIEKNLYGKKNIKRVILREKWRKIRITEHEWGNFPQNVRM